MISAFLNYSFLQNALIAGILAAIICGIIGVITVEKRLVMMTGGIAHTAYGGVGLGFLLSVEPILTAALFAIIAAVIIGFIRRKGHNHSDIIIALLWSFGMALGIFFTAIMPSYPPDMNSYLFGNILSVTKNDIYIMAGLTAVIVLIFIMFFSDWKAYLFDSAFSKVSGIKTAFLEYLLLILTAISVVVLIRVVGIILSLALLSAPAAAAAFFTKNLKSRILCATLIAALVCTVGLIISYNLSLPSGAAIVFVCVLFYFITFIIKKLLRR
jgi:zinc transport system permease protein